MPERSTKPGRGDRPRQTRRRPWRPNAQSLANSDVVSAQRAYARVGGSDTGAMLGGIILGDLLSGGMHGGFGGWSSTSFGGSSNSSPGGSDGGFMGGGGRF
ncbi:hypothetical protein BN973_03972 [Mycobacterium triplex]|uniref:Uncharacterized protein n=1 Tax=Mycobacterium triplex TaxID=47839 RepID=A0A024K1Z4_9MYCO|nr:hypothetical protein BN973_03972 [Mycobacterium triplex]